MGRCNAGASTGITNWARQACRTPAIHSLPSLRELPFQIEVTWRYLWPRGATTRAPYSITVRVCAGDLMPIIKSGLDTLPRPRPLISFRRRQTSSHLLAAPTTLVRWITQVRSGVGDTTRMAKWATPKPRSRRGRKSCRLFLRPWLVWVALWVLDRLDSLPTVATTPVPSFQTVRSGVGDTTDTSSSEELVSRVDTHRSPCKFPVLMARPEERYQLQPGRITAVRCSATAPRSAGATTRNLRSGLD
jgi:hypothetical protein